ncbi:MAG: hypothetical protein KC431_05815 [Myxococcales bacterium]|nr:hypothetical protein [Myxococcales bacterium]
MSTPVEATQQPQPQPQPESERLEQLLGDVREDARHRPEAYLEDTRVPAGGE